MVSQHLVFQGLGGFTVYTKCVEDPNMGNQFILRKLVGCIVQMPKLNLDSVGKPMRAIV